MFILIGTVIFAVTFLFISIFIFKVQHYPSSSVDPSFRNKSLILFGELSQRCQTSSIIIIGAPGKLRIEEVITITHSGIRVSNRNLGVGKRLRSRDGVCRGAFPSGGKVDFPIEIGHNGIFILTSRHRGSISDEVCKIMGRESVGKAIISIFEMENFWVGRDRYVGCSERGVFRIVINI